MRPLLWLFLGLAACVRPTEATKYVQEDDEALLVPERLFQRDTALQSQSLGQLLVRSLSDSALDAQLNAAFAACREFGVPHECAQDSGSSAPEASGSTAKEEVQYCNRVRYARHMRLKYRTMQTHVAHLASTGAIAIPDAIPSREMTDLDLQAFFEQYADRQQPVVLQSPPELPPLGLPWESMQQLIDICFGSAVNDGPAPLKLQDPACAELLSQQFRVSLFMAHDYLQRTSGSLPDFLLPSLVRLRQQQQQGTFSCPYGLHLMALPLTSNVEIALFRRQFEPLSSRTVSSGSPQEIALHADGGIDHDSTSDMVFSSAHLRQIPSTHRGDVHPHDLLFVPGSLAASARASESSQDDALLLRFCYADASNLNTVKEEIRVEALVNDDALQLLLALRSPTFDTSIPRRPVPGDALWTAFRTWPKETKLVKRSDLLNSETGSDQLQLSRRERLKLWQDDKRWDRHIESLTLPVSMAPVVVNTTRTTATLRWQDVYQPPKNDITGYGYQVEWRLESALEGAEEAADSALNVTHKQLVRSAMPTQLFGDDFDGKDIQAVVRGLQADCVYSFTVRVYVGDAMGLVSDRSRSVHTDPPSVPSEVRGVPVVQAHDATCVTLQWMDPIDDGARAISFYVVAVRDLSNSGDRDALASLTAGDQIITQDEREFAIEVSATTTRGLPSGWRATASPMCNLFPTNSYQFRMAATNSMGMGIWSTHTDPMTMPKPAALRAKATVPTICGIGDPAYVRFRGQDQASLAEIGPSALLSDVTQQLMVRHGNETMLAFDVWAGHYSPRLFQVSSEIVRADPLDASEPLRNADSVRNRLVLVTRGRVPLMFKVRYAQQAGALGVVIADADADSSCASAFDQSCVPGADRARGEGFAMLERHRFWQQNRIPCVLLAQPQARQLLSLTD